MGKYYEPKPGYKLIFRPYFRTKDGRIVTAWSKGKKVFPMWVKI